MVSAAGPGEGIRVKGRRRSPSRSPRALPQPPPTEPTSLIDSGLSPGPQTENQTRLRSCTGSRPTPSPRTPFRGQGTVTPTPPPTAPRIWQRLEPAGNAESRALPRCSGPRSQAGHGAGPPQGSGLDRTCARPSPGSSLETSLAPQRPNLEADKVHRSNGHSLSGSRGP